MHAPRSNATQASGGSGDHLFMHEQCIIESETYVDASFALFVVWLVPIPIVEGF